MSSVSSPKSRPARPASAPPTTAESPSTLRSKQKVISPARLKLPQAMAGSSGASSSRKASTTSPAGGQDPSKASPPPPPPPKISMPVSPRAPLLPAYPSTHQKRATPSVSLGKSNKNTSSDSDTTWTLKNGKVAPNLSFCLSLSSHLATQSNDDRIMRFRFASCSSDTEITVHRSRLLFVDGPLAALVRRPFTDLNHGLVTLSPDDNPSIFTYIRLFLYGLTIDLRHLSLPEAVSLAIAADRWQLAKLFHPIITYLSSLAFPDCKSLQPAAALLTLTETPHHFKRHLRGQLAIYLANSLQSTFPNPPTNGAASLLQTYHEVNDLSAALSLAARQAPFLPLVHGVFSTLESRADDLKLTSYIHALPVAAAGVSRLLACDTATARWPARAVRLATAAALAATRDVARAYVPVRIGDATCVSIGDVVVSLSAARDAQGVAVSVNARRPGGNENKGIDKAKQKDRDWSITHVCVRGEGYTCACGLLLEGCGDVVFEWPETGDGDLKRIDDGDKVRQVSRSAVVRFDVEAGDKWNADHTECGEMVLSIEVEHVKGHAAIFLRGQNSGEGEQSRGREDSLVALGSGVSAENNVGSVASEADKGTAELGERLDSGEEKESEVSKRHWLML